MKDDISTSRRGLLRAFVLAGATASLGAGPAVAARTPPPVQRPLHLQPPPILQPRLTRTLLQYSPVAGFQYHEGEDVWPWLRVGDALALVREPRNRYDPRAVRLDWEGCKNGYVPARDNAAVSQLMDRDAGLDAVMTRLRVGRDPWQRIEFAVYLSIAA